MRKLLQSLLLLLAALMVPAAAGAAYVQVAEGVYRDGSTLFITSGVTSLGMLQVNPSVIYCYATVPPACVSNTFTGYGATLHVPGTSLGSYFVTSYWNNFGNITGDAVEPVGLSISEAEAQLHIGDAVTLTATVTPSNAVPRTVYWSSTNTAVATVSGGQVTAVDVGECDIVATCLGMRAVCHVQVMGTQIQISLDKHEAKVLPNHMITITPTMSPVSTELKVTVSNPEVAAARLVNGVVQVVGLTEGTTMVVVSSTDGQAIPDACMVTVYTEVGDINSDGYVNITDVTALIDFLLSPNTTQINVTNADTDKSGGVNIADVTALIDYLLQGYWPVEEPWNEWVDLGLPSGTLWATCNVGASAPVQYGDYFAWGETAPKDYYGWSTYKWCNGRESTLTKYCFDSSYGYNGFTDGKTELDPEDDAAYVNWGPSWRMPTFEQLYELYEKCTSVWTTQNGVNGRLFTGPNGNTLFLPAAGYRCIESLYQVGSCGYYWSRAIGSYTYYIPKPKEACFLNSFQWGLNLNYITRYNGFTVRAVRVSQN